MLISLVGVFLVNTGLVQVFVTVTAVSQNLASITSLIDAWTLTNTGPKFRASRIKDQ